MRKIKKKKMESFLIVVRNDLSRRFQREHHLAWLVNQYQSSAVNKNDEKQNKTIKCVILMFSMMFMSTCVVKYKDSSSSDHVSCTELMFFQFYSNHSSQRVRKSGSNKVRRDSLLVKLVPLASTKIHSTRKS